MTRHPIPRGRRRIPGQMNATEAAYSKYLELLKKADEISEFWFEGVTLKLGKDCRFTPDFMVLLPGGELEIHETKGFWKDDAKVKMRVAAGMFPFRFVAVYAIPKREGGGWRFEEF